MRFKTLSLALLTVLFLTIPLHSEYVFLKDGSIIEGAIISDTASSVTIRMKDKKIKQVPRGNIMRLLYTELYMGKVYVQKTDGKNVICYMVDEDRVSYTFRKELYSPEEFQLKRDQVLFMARGNPTGLEGEAGTDKAEIKWFPPYNPVKKYRVYIKGPGDKQYRVTQETRGRKLTVKELKSNSLYLLYVTAIDESGDETLPSNELKITTKNLPPEKPSMKNVEKLPDGNYRLIWTPSSDPDGKVSGYRLYRKVSGKAGLVADVKNCEYTVPHGEDIDSIYLSSVDDLNAESGSVRVYNSHPPVQGISISPAFIYPLGNLKSIAGPGFGCCISFDMSNYLFSGAEFAFNIYYFHLPGRGEYAEPENKINSLKFIPAMFSAGYAFYITDDFSLVPNVAAGALLLQYDYSYFDIVESDDTGVKKYLLNSAAGGGLLLRYSVTPAVYLTLSTDYRIFFDREDHYSFITAAFGAGVRF